MAKLLFALVVAAMLAAPAHARSGAPATAASSTAADPAVSAAVRKMLIAMDYPRILKASMSNFSESMRPVMEAGARHAIDNEPNLDDAQREQAIKDMEAALPQGVARLEAIFDDPVVINEMIEAMVPLYARTFTLHEIEQMAAYHASPVGKKAMTALPRLMDEAMEVVQRVLMPRVDAAAKSILKPVKK
jgi:hypothetical protein